MTAPLHFLQTIRASSLPNGLDCELRWAADNVAKINAACMKEKSPTGKPQKAISLPFGTSGHFGVRLMLEEKQATGHFDFNKALNNATALLYEEIEKHDIRWDDYASKKEQAAAQLERLLGIAAEQYVDFAHPYLIEHELKYGWKFEWECECTQWIDEKSMQCKCGRYRQPGCRTREVVLSGHLDHMDQRGWVDDFKFGAKGGAYQAQGGGYIWLVYKVLSHDLIKSFRQIHFKRTKSLYVPAINIQYDFDACIDSAEIAINRLSEANWKYQETGDLKVFAPNANSKYCTRNTCRAWGTSQCNQWIAEIEKENKEWAM